MKGVQQMKKVMAVMASVLVCAFLAVPVCAADGEAPVISGSAISVTGLVNTVTMTNRGPDLVLVTIDTRNVDTATTGTVSVVLNNGDNVPVTLYSSAAVTGGITTTVYSDGSGVRRWKKGGTLAVAFTPSTAVTVTNFYVIHTDPK